MKTKDITCTICPQGCRIRVCADECSIVSIEGAGCKRGETYARGEFTQPMRLLTSTALVTGGNAPLVPLRSGKPVPKTQLHACMDEVRKLRLNAPVRRGDILIQNILGTGCDIIATGSVDRAKQAFTQKDE